MYLQSLKHAIIRKYFVLYITYDQEFVLLYGTAVSFLFLFFVKYFFDFTNYMRFY